MIDPVPPWGMSRVGITSCTMLLRMTVPGEIPSV